METEQALVVQDYDQLKKNVVSKVETAISTNVLQSLKQDSVATLLENDTGFLRTLRGYFGEDAGRLTKETIQEKVNEEGALRVIKEIAGKPTLYNLGLFCLESLTVTDMKKLFKNAEFLDWAVSVTSSFPYPLQNEKLDSVILEGMSGNPKLAVDKFSEILRVVTANASSGSLEVFDRLIVGLRETEKKRTLESATAYENRRKEIYQKIDTVFKSIFKILETHKKAGSFKFYFEMNPKYIKSICISATEMESKENFRWLEPFLQNLLSYYVHCAKNYRLTTDISALWENIRLNEVFEAVFRYSSNPNIKQNILNSYSSDNEFLPYLPLNLIKDTMDSEDDAQKRLVITYLQKRYGISPEGEKKELTELNDRILLNKKLNIGIRHEAFLWYFEMLGESSPEEKTRWAANIFNKIITEDDDNQTANSIPYTTMLRVCFNSVFDADLNSPDLTLFIIRTRNQNLSTECFEGTSKNSWEFTQIQ